MRVSMSINLVMEDNGSITYSFDRTPTLIKGGEVLAIDKLTQKLYIDLVNLGNNLATHEGSIVWH